MEYKVRRLNLLDIRRMAKILKEVNMSKEDFKNIVADIFSSATMLSTSRKNAPEGQNIIGKDSGDYIGGFIKAIAPALDGLIDLLADSDSFWEFLASLLRVPYEELENIGLFEIKDIFASLIGDEQVTAFFTSITGAEPAAMTAV